MGFHSHGESPIAGWFTMNNPINMDTFLCWEYGIETYEGFQLVMGDPQARWLVDFDGKSPSKNGL